MASSSSSYANVVMNSAEGPDDMPVSLDLHPSTAILENVDLTLHRLISNQLLSVLVSPSQSRMANW